MHEISVDGVPVFWEQGPEPLSAGLCFGVGRRNESFATAGITHLIEHLVMGALPKSHLDRNASVSPKLTEFTATGRPAAVAEFLGQVCALLAEVPLDRLDVEARVLAAEAARSGGDTLGLLLLLRYGVSGIGLTGVDEPGLSSLSGEQVRDHAARWFVRENAALWITGPPPDGLKLSLPAGSRPPSIAERRTPRRFPGTMRYPGSDPAFSFELATRGADSPLVMSACRILLDRLTQRLRHVGGYSYDLDFHAMHVEPGWSHLAFFADAHEKDVAAVLAEMHATIQELASDGPTQAELDHDLEGFRENSSDPRATFENVASAVRRRLDGMDDMSDDAVLAILEARTAEQVADVLKPALGTLLFLVPEDCPPVLPSLGEMLDSSRDPLTGRVWKRRWRSDLPRTSRLTTSPEGVTLDFGFGLHCTVLYADCVAVGVAKTDHRHLLVVGSDGSSVPVCDEDWRDGSALLAEVTSAVTGVPSYQFDPDEED